ncbi:GntR family transcriptional regulator [Corynebacterium epidermidicanis]|uniref:Putative transcriptional regulator n=1 Tax=Corynebacterium epidermidicanis TaxID=1050174 RepID=A0A0G3GNJ2_9CORY|nr:GntR family transcriptional regulator [Corynebacterium epidermidicanis]AKK02709.1 putative transcriptional regulator [Corynebacterium epidermidicanis]
MQLDPNSPIPLFQQLHDEIIADIARGKLPRGTKLNSVRKVAANFGINPATVKKAYDLLQSEGIVATHGRSGTVVVMEGTQSLQDELVALVLRAHAQGVSTAQLHDMLDAATSAAFVEKG